MTTQEFEQILDPDIKNQLQGFAMLLSVPFETLLEEALQAYLQTITRQLSVEFKQKEYYKLQYISFQTGLHLEKVARWMLMEYLERVQEAEQESA